jgi:hypothetical protein
MGAMSARLSRKLGVSLIVASCGMWAIALSVVPFLPIANGGTPATAIAYKVTLTTGLILGSEVLFWVGILLVGKEFARSYRQKLSPRCWWQRVTNRRF